MENSQDLIVLSVSSVKNKVTTIKVNAVTNNRTVIVDSAKRSFGSVLGTVLQVLG